MLSFLEIGLANAACAAGIALLAYGVSRVCRRPAVMHALWLLVLIKLVTPPIFSLPLRLLPAPETAIAANAPTPTSSPSNAAPEPTHATGEFLILPTSKQGDVLIAMKVTDLPEVVVTKETASHTVSATVTPQPEPMIQAAPAAGFDWNLAAQIAVGCWILGSICWFAISVIRMIRFARLLRLARSAPETIEIRAAHLARRMGLSRCPEIALIPGLVPPLLWMAIGRPIIYLPIDLLDQLDDAELDTLLAHELAHLRRRDHWVRWLEFVVQGIYWWNPVVLFVRRQVQAHEEECCDALVTDLLPARSYASAIVQTLDFLAGARPLPVPASGLRRVANLKNRLTQILAGGRSGRLGLSGRATIGAMAFAFLPLLPSLARSGAVATAKVGKVAVELATTHSSQASATIDTPDNDAAKEIQLAEPSPARAIAYSPDGRQLAIAMENHSIEIHDASTGDCVRRLLGHTDRVNCVVYSPDGEWIASGSSDHTVRLWNAHTGQCERSLEGHENWVYALAFSPDSKTLASGGYDRTVRLWKTATGESLRVLNGHDSAVRALAFSPDGKMLASGGGDQKIQLWDLASRQVHATLTGHSDTVRALAFAAKGDTLASAGNDGTIRLWNPQNGTLRATLAGHRAEVTSLAFSPWGRILVSAGMDHTIRWWNLSQNKQVAEVPATRDGVIGLAFAPSNDKLAVLGQDCRIQQITLSRISVRMRAVEPSRGAVAVMNKKFVYRRGAVAVATSHDGGVPAVMKQMDANETPRILILEITRAQ